MTVAELLAKIGFQVEDKPLDAVQSKLEGIQRRLEFLGAAEVLKGVAELGKRFGEFAENLGVNASAAGVTAEALQKLQFAAGLSGVSSDKVSESLSFLSRSLNAARTGSKEAAQTFAEIGISPSQIQSFATTKDALAAVSDRIAGIQDPVKKQAMTMAMLGRGAGQMTEWLSKGSKGWAALGEEAESVGAVLSSQTLEILRDTGDSLNTLWQVARNFAATIISYVGPGIQQAVTAMLEFWKANRKVIELNIKKFVEDFLFALGYFYGVVSVVISRILEWAAAHQEVVDAAEKVIGVLTLVSGGIWGVHKAIDAVKGIIAAVNVLISPWFLIPALLTLITLLVHSLYEEIFKGKDFKDTMLGQILSGTGIFGVTATIRKWLEKGGVVDVDATESLKKAGLQGPKFGEEGGTLHQMAEFLAREGGGENANPYTGDAALLGEEPVGANVSIDAPITITVPEGTDPKLVADKVTDALKKQMDEKFREAQRALKTARKS